MTERAATRRAAVQPFFHVPSHTCSYVAQDPATLRAAVLDSVLDCDAAAGRTRHDSADAIVDFVRSAVRALGITTAVNCAASGLAGRRVAADFISSGILGAFGAGRLAQTRGALNRVFAGMIILIAICMPLNSRSLKSMRG